MSNFIMGFFRNNAPESMTRATLFFAASVVNLMCVGCTFMFYFSDGKLDYSSQVALLSGLLLGGSGTMKMIQNKQEIKDP